MASRRIISVLLAVWLFRFGFSNSALAADATTNELVPNLSIDIPGVSFSSVLSKGGVLEINFLQDYIAGVYTYLLGIGTLIAIVLVMIGGLQYTLAAGTGDVKKAQERIRNAVTGLTLLLCVFLIMTAINPQLVIFKPLKVLNIEGIALERGINSNEGLSASSSNSASSSSSTTSSACEDITQTAKEEGTCEIAQEVSSPTGEPPICDNNSHWTDEAGDYKEYTEITELDFAAEFGTAIMAPFDGTVTYTHTTGTKCGNYFVINGSGQAAGAAMVFCHVKDYVNDAGQYEQSLAVSQGDTIGHSGGVWCKGEVPPTEWGDNDSVVSGTPCTDPDIEEACDCQTTDQAGLSKQAHIHTQWRTGGDLLACFEE